MNSPQPLNDPPELLPSGVNFVNGMVDSTFLTVLRDAFHSPAAFSSLWDSKFTKLTAFNRKELIAADIAGAFRSVFLRNEVPTLEPEPGPENSATKLMKEVLLGNALGWPSDLTKFPVPAPYKAASFRRYEVACAVSIIVQAYNRTSPGGGDPANFPPSRPNLVIPPLPPPPPPPPGGGQ